MNPVVETRFGRVRGRREDGVACFRGVPYAAPPTGPRRFRAPVGPEPWSGVRDALAHGPPAPQRPGELSALLGLGPDGTSEDCLTLSVTTPDVAGRRPVLVWLHGGGFVTGTAGLPVYEGAALARRGDVVVVGVNYRLGALGFLPLLDGDGESVAGEGEPFANFGVLDQLAALAFVREHAEAFGGDPERITVFGESAGAMAIGALLGAPRARGLFRRAILQSGAAENVHGREAAARVARAFAEALGVAPGDRRALEEAPVAKLLDAQQEAVARVWREVRGVTFQPVVDGDLLPEAPLAAIEGGAAHDVGLLLGTNRDENRLWSAFDAKVASLDEDLLRRRCRVRLGEHAAPVIEAYRDWLGAEAAPEELWSAIETDRAFGAPAHRLARAQGAHRTDTFVYHFTWASPALEGRLGACHALEIPFVFGTHRHERLAPLVGAGPEVDALSERMQACWLGFAERGEPAAPEGGPWPAWAPPRHATRVFGGECRVEEGHFGERAALWDAVLP